MKSRTPKLLHELCGRPMVSYVVDAATQATGARPLVVTSPPTAAVREALGDDAVYALQPEPRGTGDAVATAVAALPDDVDEVLVLSGDVPLVESGLLRELLDERRLDEAAIALIAVDAIDPGDLGRVVRDDAGIVDRIVERKDATDEELAVTEINSGLYAFDAVWLRARIGSLKPSPKTGELYLTELVELARADGRVVAALTVEDDGRLLGINDRAELAQAEWDMRTRINAGHMINGVTMRDPSTVYVDAGGRARDRRHDRAQRHHPRRDVGRGGESRSARAARSSTARSAPAARSGRASSSRRRSRTAPRSGRSATSVRARSWAATRRSATSPS